MSLPTTVIGSFPRPTELVELYYRKSTGAFVDEQRFAALIENAMHKHVQLQVRCGVDIVSSGEASQPNFVTYVTQRLTGFDGEQTVWEMINGRQRVRVSMLYLKRADILPFTRSRENLIT